MVRLCHNSENWLANQSQCIHCRLCIYLSTSSRPHPYAGPQTLLHHSFVLLAQWIRFSIDWNAGRWRRLWCVQVISMTSSIICIGFYHKWQSEAHRHSALQWRCEYAPPSSSIDPASTSVQFNFDTTHSAHVFRFIIRSKLLSRSATLIRHLVPWSPAAELQPIAFRQKVSGTHWEMRATSTEIER